MRILVCDDDALFAKNLVEKLHSLLVDIGRNAEIDLITDSSILTQELLAQYEIVFLDIDMPKVNGIEVAKRLRSVREDVVLIFVTNYIEYSIEGYEVQAFRYLLKKDIDKRLASYLAHALSAYDRQYQKVRISCDGKEMNILPQSILYIEALAGNTFLHKADHPCEKMKTRITLAELTQQLEPHGFLRVHKSFLVNMTHIQKLQSTRVWLAGDVELPVSSHNFSKIKQDYIKWKGRQRWNIG